jgi:formyltetrahydrofolate deformylase
MTDHILTLSCPDKPGIVHAVTGLLAKENLNILDSQQFSDPVSRKFFMRVHFGHVESTEKLSDPFAKLAESMDMEYEIVPKAKKPRVLMYGFSS